MLDALPGCAIIYVEDLRAGFRFADKLWLMAFAMRFPRLAITKQSTLDPAVILFTSGSEDRPKGVVLSATMPSSRILRKSAQCSIFPQATKC